MSFGPDLVEVLETHALMEIRDHVARKNLRMVLRSDGDVGLPVSFRIRLEPCQHVDRLTARVDGRVLEGTFVRSSWMGGVPMEGPLTLIHDGSRWVRITLAGVLPGREFEVRLETLEVLAQRNGTVAVDTLNPPLGSRRNQLRESTVRARVTSSVPLRQVFSPTHPVEVQRRGPSEALLSYSAREILPMRRFRFGYTLDLPEAPADPPDLDPIDDDPGPYPATPRIVPVRRLPRDPPFVPRDSRDGLRGREGPRRRRRTARRSSVHRIDSDTTPYSTGYGC